MEGSEPPQTFLSWDCIPLVCESRQYMWSCCEYLIHVTLFFRIIVHIVLYLALSLWRNFNPQDAPVLGSRIPLIHRLNPSQGKDVWSRCVYLELPTLFFPVGTLKSVILKTKGDRQELFSKMNSTSKNTSIEK